MGFPSIQNMEILYLSVIYNYLLTHPDTRRTPRRSASSSCWRGSARRTVRPGTAAISPPGPHSAARSAADSCAGSELVHNPACLWTVRSAGLFGAFLRRAPVPKPGRACWGPAPCAGETASRRRYGDGSVDTQMKSSVFGLAARARNLPVRQSFKAVMTTRWAQPRLLAVSPDVELGAERRAPSAERRAPSAERRAP